MIRRFLIVVIVSPLFLILSPLLVLLCVLSIPYNYVVFGNVEMYDFLGKFIDKIRNLISNLTLSCGAEDKNSDGCLRRNDEWYAKVMSLPTPYRIMRALRLEADRLYIEKTKFALKYKEFKLFILFELFILLIIMIVSSWKW